MQYYVDKCNFPKIFTKLDPFDTEIFGLVVLVSTVLTQDLSRPYYTGNKNKSRSNFGSCQH